MDGNLGIIEGGQRYDHSFARSGAGGFLWSAVMNGEGGGEEGRKGSTTKDGW